MIARRTTKIRRSKSQLTDFCGVRDVLSWCCDKCVFVMQSLLGVNHRRNGLFFFYFILIFLSFLLTASHSLYLSVTSIYSPLLRSFFLFFSNYMLLSCFLRSPPGPTLIKTMNLLHFFFNLSLFLSVSFFLSLSNT